MKFTDDATLPFAADQVDLSKWLFTMADQEYQGVAPGHRALGTFIADDVRGHGQHPPGLGGGAWTMSIAPRTADTSTMKWIRDRFTDDLEAADVTPIDAHLERRESVANENEDLKAASAEVSEFRDPPALGPVTAQD